MAFNLGTAVGYLMLDTSGFEKGFKTASTQLKTFFDSSQSLNTRLNGLSSGLTSIGANLTKNITLPLVGLGTAAAVITSKFESSMSQVQATLGITKDSMTTLNDETVNTMDSLESLARQLGADTKYSASEAADAINNMAMAGYNVQEIYDTLPQVLSLASAGCLDLDYATQLVANGLNVMGKDTKYAQELADKLAVTASNAYGSVSDFGEGLLVAGGQASLANLSFTDTFTALGILGDNGISASEGGTMLRNVLKNLYTPTNESAKALEALGIKTSDADGKLRSFKDVLRDLNTSLDGLTDQERIQAMADIFDVRTIAGANALLKDCGDRWDELSGAIDNADGAAERMAETQLDNLPGQLTILKSALEEAAIGFGQVLLPVIKDVVRVVQNVVTWINNLTDSQKNAIVRIVELAAIIGPVLIIVGKIVGVFSKLVGLFTGAISPVGVIIGLIAALAAAFVYFWNTSEKFRQFWIELWESIKQVVSNAIDIIIDIWNVLSDFFATAWSAIYESLQPAIEAVINAFEAAWSLIQTVWSALKPFFESLVQGIIDIWNGIVPVFVLIWDQIKIAAETAWNIIVDVFSAAWDLIKSVWSVAVSFFSTLWNTVAGIFSAVEAVLSGDFKGAWEAIKGIFSTWGDFFKGLWEQLVTVFSGAVNLGKKIVDDIKQGISNAWESLVSWFKGLWDSLFGNLNANVNVGTVSGSAATGLDYVSKDGLWQLHEGERVLSKEENAEYSNGNNRSSGDVYNFYSPKALSPTSAARAMQKAKRQLAAGVY